MMPFWWYYTSLYWCHGSPMRAIKEFVASLYIFFYIFFIDCHVYWQYWFYGNDCIYLLPYKLCARGMNGRSIQRHPAVSASGLKSCDLVWSSRSVLRSRENSLSEFCVKQNVHAPILGFLFCVFYSVLLLRSPVCISMSSSEDQFNQFVSSYLSLCVCFRPPRDLDSKACVTIGEKVHLISLKVYPPSPYPLPFFYISIISKQQRLSKGFVSHKGYLSEHYSHLEAFWL